MKKMLGVMLDCSRNAVMTVESVKKYAELIKKMGYNTLMLYTEDTFEIDTEPFFGHLRGKYTKDELKEIDGFCNEIGLELIPCIQTLAHLNAIFKWKKVYGSINDCDDILLIDEEKTYELIEKMIKTTTECFSSKKIHIGMDEATRVGLGKHLNKHGYENKFELMSRHLKKVYDIVNKYALEPMVWHDMFLDAATGTNGIHEMINYPEKISENSLLPENTSLVYWNYYQPAPDIYISAFNACKLFGRNIIFAGGANAWRGFAPFNSYSITNTKAGLDACKKCGIDDVLMTVWGDDGNECSRYSILPTLMFAAEYSKGNTDMESIKAKFKEITGCDFDNFTTLDEFDTPGRKHQQADGWQDVASKYILYNDIFMGKFDYKCSEGDNEYYKNLADKIRNLPNKGEFEYLFDRMAKHADILSIKAELGIKIRKAYLDKNLKELENLAKVCDELVERINIYHQAFEAEWHSDYKPHGFDVQDVRLGGLIKRTESCRNRLLKFVSGKINSIPELQEPVLTENSGFFWKDIVSGNVL